MSPFRWDVLLVGFVLALPVFALGLRGDLSTEEMMIRLLWCLGAGWVAVALLRFAEHAADTGAGGQAGRSDAHDAPGGRRARSARLTHPRSPSTGDRGPVHRPRRASAHCTVAAPAPEPVDRREPAETDPRPPN